LTTPTNPPNSCLCPAPQGASTSEWRGGIPLLETPKHARTANDGADWNQDETAAPGFGDPRAERSDRGLVGMTNRDRSTAPRRDELKLG